MRSIRSGGLFDTCWHAQQTLPSLWGSQEATYGARRRSSNSSAVKCPVFWNSSARG
jgi:hypothetical protein